MQDEIIEEVVRRLVDFYQPERIYLFGSAARDDVGPDSGLTFCVVLPDHASACLCRNGGGQSCLRGAAEADVVQLLSSDFDRRALHVKASLPATVVRDGRLLYDARG